MVSAETRAHAEKWAKALQDGDVEAAKTIHHKDVSYTNYMTHNQNLEFSDFIDAFEDGTRAITISSIDIGDITGYDIDKSNTADPGKTTTIKWEMQATWKHNMGPIKAGKEYTVVGCTIWAWKEGKVVDSTTYGQWNLEDFA